MPKLTAIRKQALDEIMKEAIFKAAVSALSARGVKGLTMDRVASEAGVAKGSLYRYFRSKRDLLEFVHAKLVDPIRHGTDDIIAGDGSAIDKLSEQLTLLLDHVAKYVQIHRLLFDDEAAYGLLQSSERRTVEAATRRLAEIFRQGIAEGVFRPADPMLLAAMYLGLCRSVLQTRPELGEPGQRKTVHDLILGTLLHGVRP